MKPHQLAKILKTMLVVSPGEYGLFWDKDGTMPWKEFYWALQREEDLKFVRESHIREIELAGIEMPFFMEEGRLKLKLPIPDYEPATPTEHLFMAIPLRAVPFIRAKGILVPSHRSYIALWNRPEISLKMAKPSTTEKYIVIAVDPDTIPGHPFYRASEGLFLTDIPIPPRALIIPPISEKELDEIKEIRKERTTKQHKTQQDIPKQYGSFMLTVEAFKREFGESEEEPDKKDLKKRRSKGPDWKRESRKIRKSKRTI